MLPCRHLLHPQPPARSGEEREQFQRMRSATHDPKDPPCCQIGSGTKRACTLVGIAVKETRQICFLKGVCYLPRQLSKAVLLSWQALVAI
eukprot:375281-Pelagomonas_calceolata.AAC.1